MKVSGKMTKVFAVLMMVTMLIGTFGVQKIKAENNYIIPAQSNGRFDFHAEPGDLKHIVIPVKNATGRTL